jgi:hypothetical protein
MNEKLTNLAMFVLSALALILIDRLFFAKKVAHRVLETYQTILNEATLGQILLMLLTYKLIGWVIEFFTDKDESK